MRFRIFFLLFFSLCLFILVRRFFSVLDRRAITPNGSAHTLPHPPAPPRTPPFINSNDEDDGAHDDALERAGTGLLHETSDRVELITDWLIDPPAQDAGRVIASLQCHSLDTTPRKARREAMIPQPLLPAVPGEGQGWLRST